MAISPDNKTLASGSADGTIKIWDLATGEQLLTLTGHKGEVNSVTFSSDGKVASGGKDRTIRLWYFDLDYLIQRGCNWLQDYLIAHPEDAEMQKICKSAKLNI